MPEFNIDAFQGKINATEGLMRTNRFSVLIQPPPLLIDFHNITRGLEFNCEAVHWPGYMMMSHDVRRWTYGPSEKRPFGPNFTQLQCIFQNDTQNQAWDFFNNWMQLIIGHDTRFTTAYEVDYKNSYSTEIRVRLYDEASNIRSTIVCREAFPSQCVDVQLGWTDVNDYFKFQVSFDFTDWYTETT